jgi:DNA end-binding protein Ku
MGLMPRSIWTGAISFGLVTVPVKLYSAVQRKTVRFHQLNGKTGVRIQQKRVDPTTGDEVPYEEIVKGYEIAPDQLRADRARRARGARSRRRRKTIEIPTSSTSTRSTRSSTTTRTTSRPRPAAPSPTGCCSRRCARAARSAIAKVVIRQKENLVAIRPMEGGVLGMATMIFADEVVRPDGIDDLPEATSRPPSSELDMRKHADRLARRDFEPEKYQTPTAKRCSR